MPAVQTKISGIMLIDDVAGKFAVNSLRTKTRTELYSAVATKVQAATGRDRSGVRNISYKAARRIERVLNANGITLAGT